MIGFVLDPDLIPLVSINAILWIHQEGRGGSALLSFASTL